MVQRTAEHGAIVPVVKNRKMQSRIDHDHYFYLSKPQAE
jgi:hypothetical protein